MSPRAGGGIASAASLQTSPRLAAAVPPQVATDASDTLLDSSRCAICLSDFSEGEEITHLPCGHCFHRGTETGDSQSESSSRPAKAAKSSDATKSPRATSSGTATSPVDASDCPGVLAWLKQNNECPLCRKQLPAETPTASARLGGFFGGANGGELPRGIQVSIGHTRSDGGIPPPFFLGMPPSIIGSSGGGDVFGGFPFGVLPLGALAFSGLMGEIAAGIDELQERAPSLRSRPTRRQAPTGSRAAHAAIVGQIDYSQSWQCPGCMQVNPGDAMLGSISACNCGVRRRVLALSETMALPVFNEAVDIFVAARKLVSEQVSDVLVEEAIAKVGSKRRAPTPVSRSESLKAQSSALLRRIERLVDGGGMQELESSGWRVRDSIDVLLHAALKVQPDTTIRIYLSRTGDSNSNGLLNVLINSIRKELNLEAQTLQIVPFFSRFSPFMSSSSVPGRPDHSFGSERVNARTRRGAAAQIAAAAAEVARPRVFSPSPITQASASDLPHINNRHHRPAACVNDMLDSTTGDILSYAQRLAYGVCDLTWQRSMVADLESFTRRGWAFNDGFARMRTGERRLEVVASGVDNNSAAVLEALLGIVVDFEASLIRV